MLQSLSDLNSVVKVLDYFEANNSAYLVMEYLDGLSLKDHVEKNGKFDAQPFLNQMKPLMADMEKMHRRGVVHRDIAPDNIILLSDGRLKLIDFGAARSYVGDKSMTVVVKKGFAPVEQYMRKGSNASTDVYALAATIYSCITGIVPPDSAERQYGEAVLKAPAELGADITVNQEQALEKALEIQPKDRTQNVADLAQNMAQTPKLDTDAQKAAAIAAKRKKEAAAAAKQAREAAAAAAKQAREAAAAAAKQEREAKAAAEKQEREARAAAAKQEREAKAAAEKQEREVRAAAIKQEREVRAAAEKQKKDAAVATAKQKQEAKAAAAEEKRQKKESAKSKHSNPRRIVIAAACSIAVLAPLAYYVVFPAYMYGQALSLMEAGEYENAIAAFEDMDGYRESAQKIELCWDGIRERLYQEAVLLMESGKYPEAIAVFEELDNYKDSQSQISECQNTLIYQDALTLLDAGDYQAAIQIFRELGNYKDCSTNIQECMQLQKQAAIKEMNTGHYRNAMDILLELEASGMDCSSEIQKCELGILHNSNKQYITRGNPIGEKIKIHYTVHGNITIHSITRVDLDNECVRYAIDCTPLECKFVTFCSISSRNNNPIFMFSNWDPPQNRHTFVFDVAKSQIEKVEGLRVEFGGLENYIIVQNPY